MRRRVDREYRLPPDSGRSPSSICPDLICDKDRRPHHERRREPRAIAPADYQLVGRVSRDNSGVLGRQIAASDPVLLVRRRPGAIGIAKYGPPERPLKRVAAHHGITELHDRVRRWMLEPDATAVVERHDRKSFVRKRQRRHLAAGSQSAVRSSDGGAPTERQLWRTDLLN
jgi:hypothetical protein